MPLEKSDLDSIKELLDASPSVAQGTTTPTSLFDMEARDRIIQTNELIKQQQTSLAKNLEKIESRLDSIETTLQKSEEASKVFEKRYTSLATWLNHYQTWSVMLAIATAVSVIIGLRYFPF
jgi:flagellar capping protein FliD